MPAGLQYVAQVLPPTHVFAAARAVLSDEPLPWGSIGWGALGAVVLAVGSVWFVMRMLAAFRSRGYISRLV